MYRYINLSFSSAKGFLMQYVQMTQFRGMLLLTVQVVGGWVGWLLWFCGFLSDAFRLSCYGLCSWTGEAVVGIEEGQNATVREGPCCRFKSCCHLWSLYHPATRC